MLFANAKPFTKALANDPLEAATRLLPYVKPLVQDALVALQKLLGSLIEKFEQIAKNDRTQLAMDRMRWILKAVKDAGLLLRNLT